MYKEVKIVMLPSEETGIKIGDITKPNKDYFESNPLLGNDLGLAIREFKANKSYTTQHLYITSDDEIKEGDWILLKSIGKGQIGKYSFDKEYQTHDLTTLSNVHYPYKTKEYFVKVIASTDKSLNLPSLSDEFLKEFIETYNKKLSVVAKVQYDEGVVGKDWEDRVPTDEIYCWPATGEYDELEIKIYLHIKESWNKEEVEALLFKLHKQKTISTHFDIYEWTKQNLK